MEKNHNSRITEHIPSENDIELINKYAVSPLRGEDVFVFNVVLCDNEIDRDYERFDEGALAKIAELFVGKSGIFDHSMKGKDQVARIFKTELCSDGSQNSLGEQYLFVKAGAYMTKTQENAALINDIRAGIKKEVSVNCGIEGVFCSVCGENMRNAKCEHIKGTTYGSKMCFGIMKNPADAYEWSFVAVPAQPRAGVVKSFKKAEKETNMESILKSLKETKGSVTLKASEAEALVKAFEALKTQAEEGKLYREELEKRTVKLCLAALDGANAEDFGKICKKLTTEELRSLETAFAKEASKKMPVGIQLKPSEKTDFGNDEFKI